MHHMQKKTRSVHSVFGKEYQRLRRMSLYVYSCILVCLFCVCACICVCLCLEPATFFIVCQLLCVLMVFTVS